MPFTRPTLSELVERSEADISSRLGIGPLLRRSVLAVLARVFSGAVHLVYGFLDYIAKQVIPDTADDEHLERWASIWGVQRNAATFASGNVTFTGTNGAVVSAGSLLQRSDSVQYATQADATIASGTATVAVQCIGAGSVGNSLAGVALSMVSPVAGVTIGATVASGGLTGGADTETNDALRTRLLDRIKQAPHGGADFDYVKWAKENTGVTRAWCYPLYLGPGTVGVAFVTDGADGGLIPDAGTVAAVQSYIDARRPVTAAVTVFAPIAAPINFNITLSPSTAAVKAAVAAELADLLQRDAVPGGTILLSRIREAVSVAAGESDNVVNSPTANVTNTAGRIATLGTITWS